VQKNTFAYHVFPPISNALKRISRHASKASRPWGARFSDDGFLAIPVARIPVAKIQVAARIPVAKIQVAVRVSVTKV
jgi:hypothetical protein